METKYKILILVFFLFTLLLGMVWAYSLGYTNGGFELAKEKLKSEYYKTQYLQVCELNNKIAERLGLEKIICEDYLLK